MNNESIKMVTVPLSEYERMREQVAQFTTYKEGVKEEISKEYEERIKTICEINRKYMAENDGYRKEKVQLLASSLKMQLSLEELVGKKIKLIILCTIFGALGWIGFIFTLIYLKLNL